MRFWPQYTDLSYLIPTSAVPCNGRQKVLKNFFQPGVSFNTLSDKIYRKLQKSHQITQINKWLKSKSEEWWFSFTLQVRIHLSCQAPLDNHISEITFLFVLMLKTKPWAFLVHDAFSTSDFSPRSLAHWSLCTLRQVSITCIGWF